MTKIKIYFNIDSNVISNRKKRNAIANIFFLSFKYVQFIFLFNKINFCLIKYLRNYLNNRDNRKARTYKFTSVKLLYDNLINDNAMLITLRCVWLCQHYKTR